MDTQKEEQFGQSPAETPAAVVQEMKPEPVMLPAAPWYQRRALLGSIIVALLLVGSAGYYVYANMYKQGGVVATVNGEKIYRMQYEENVRLLEESAVGQGIDPSDEAARGDIRKQALDNLIDNALLIDAAHDTGVTVSEEKVQEIYGQLVTDVGGEEALTTRMAEMGITAEKLNANIRERILVDTYIESVSDIETLTVTEEEVTAFIAQHIPADAEIPPLEEIKPVIEGQILSLKQQEMVSGIISTLRANAEIDIRL